MKFKIKLVKVAKILSVITLIVASVIVTLTIFLVGYVKGYAFGQIDQQALDQSLLSQAVSATARPIPTSTAAPKIVYVTPKPVAKTGWGGPELWEAVNKRRVQLGVGPLQVKDSMCTIASIRLNELLELGKLDGHAGFSKIAERPDIKPTFDKYNIAEFLVSGADSPQNAVDLWEHSLGHKELVSGGQYVWGCIYAQNGFGVAITAY